MKSRCSAFNCVIDHFRDNAFGKESDTGEADLHILHPMSAAFVRSTDIYLIHKIMQYIYANDFENGIAIVAKGKWTIDPKWDNKYNQGRYWTEEELWGAIDKDGNEVIPFIFDEIKHFFDRSDMFMVHYGGWKDGHWGVVDCKGNPVTKYVYENEIDRKRSRFAEGVIASSAPAEELALARRLLITMNAQFLDDITFNSLVEAYSDNGTEKVRWITHPDDRRCKTCRAMHGKIYPIDNIPAKPHIHCRCWVEEVENT